jgi:uncharacterized protein YecE (DUF72 family)
VAYIIVDEPLLPPDANLTSDLAYIRWHGRGIRPWFNYKCSEEQLDEWVPVTARRHATYKGHRK